LGMEKFQHNFFLKKSLPSDACFGCRFLLPWLGTLVSTTENYFTFVVGVLELC
jgi:hypothetical protein